LPHRIRRYFFFGMTILAGIGLGIFIGYRVLHVQNPETAPDTLRIDYKTDYVLMVAAIYHQDGNAPAAEVRLSFLGDASHLKTIQTAIAYAQERGYAPVDIQKMLDLADAIQDLTKNEP